MASIYYGKLSIVAVTATDAASGYPASNAALESLGRPWRSADAGAKDVVLDLGSSQAINAIFLHDVNFASATIARSADNVSYTSVGALTTYAGRHGRRRGKISLAGASARYVKISISAGTPADGAAYWRIGAAYLFASKVSPTAILVLPLNVTTRRPRASVDLPNGATAIAVTGAPIDRIEINVDRDNAQSADDLIQLVDAGSAAFDMELANYPEQMWPVRYLENQLAESFNRPLRSGWRMVFTEIV